MKAHTGWRSAVLLAVGLMAAPATLAHSFELTRTLIVLRSDGNYQVDITCDLDALALGVSPTADSAELAAILEAMSAEELASKKAALVRYFERRVRVRFDGEPITSTITFPRHVAPRAGPEFAIGTEGDLVASEEPEDLSEVPTFLGLTARLEGRIPESARDITFSASRSFPPVVLTVLHEGSMVGRRELLEPAAQSTAFPIDVSADGGGPALPRLEVAGRYLALGFWHIVPEGLDHILFVLGLFFLSARWRPLLWQVSAFTLAHTLTLALSTYGVVQLPPHIVEPLIALSIAYVAIENLLTRELKPWRPLLVFAFGLLHGLGFAGVLGELGLPAEERFTALLAFNGGVEIGQLAVLLAAFLVFGWAREREWYRQRVTVPCSLLIAAMGLYWAIERVVAG